MDNWYFFFSSKKFVIVDLFRNPIKIYFLSKSIKQRGNQIYLAAPTPAPAVKPCYMEIPHQGPLTAQSHYWPLHHTTTAYYFQLEVSRAARKYFNLMRRGGKGR